MTSPEPRPLRIAHIANTDYFCAFLLRAQLDRLRAAGHDVEIVCGPGPLVADLEARRFRVHVIRNSRRIDPLADIRTLAAYAGLFRRERYDVVHTHNPKVNALASLAARIARVPRVVSTVHGFYSHEGQRPGVRRVWRAFEGASARLADLVLCQSGEDVRAARWQRIVPDERLRPLGNGVDVDALSPERFSTDDRDAIRRRLGVRAGERTIGFVGRLVHEKGVLELLEAVRHRRGWRLLLVGPDERGHKADALAPRKLASSNATWLGLQRDMPPLYSAMDVVVLPSYREGFPRSLVEASAMGRPIVATDVRGCREVVSRGRTGLLVPPRATAPLRSALESLLGDASRARRFGRAARRRALDRFDERAVFERIDLAYRELALPRAHGSANRVDNAGI